MSPTTPSPRYAAILALVLLSALSAFGADQDFAAPLPAKDDYPSFVAFVQALDDRLRSGPRIDQMESPDFFTVLIEAKRDEGVMMLARAYKEVDEGLGFCFDGRFVNPVTLAYLAGRTELVRRLLEFEPQFVNDADCYGGGRGRTPVSVAVQRDDLESLRYFISKGADLSAANALFDPRLGLFESNLLTVSPSRRMTDFLLSKGVPRVSMLDPGFPAKATCTTAGARLYKEARANSPVVARLAEGDALTILGYTFEPVLTYTSSERWVLVQRGATKGWIYGWYLDVEEE